MLYLWLLLIKVLFRNKDTEEKINILKLDIEGEEFRTIPNLIDSNILDNIQQLNVEVHAHSHLDITPRSMDEMASMLENWKQMQSRGYRIVNYNPNLTMEKYHSPGEKYYQFFDVTLVKNL